MSKLLGCVLIVSGVAVAGLGLPLSAGGSGISGDVREIVASVPVQAPRAEAAAASEGPQTIASLLRVLGTESRPLQPNSEVDAPAPARRKPIAPFQTITVPNEPAALARALQGELRRVGCYAGEINGAWSPATRKAMKTFTNRVNATLPIDKPDYILLTLVQGQQGAICNQPCQPGQGLGREGQCLPAGILAHAEKKVRVQVAAPVGVVPPLASEPGKPDPAQPTLVAAVPGPAEPASASPPFASDTPRMGLAGPVAPEAPGQKAAGPSPEADGTAKTAAKEKNGQKRERREAEARKPAVAGQTRWAREFFARHDRGIY